MIIIKLSLATMTHFSKKVIQLIQKIPVGKVATYGQIAMLAGSPRGARGVSWILHSSSHLHKLPWQRVINSKGRISFAFGTKKYHEQKNKLHKEGVEISEEGLVDLKKYAWKKKIGTR